MNKLNFDKTRLTDLEYLLGREMLSTNRTGGYLSTTIAGCNTRKYHGLLVVPIPELSDERNYVMLSSVDETVICDGQSFELAAHRFPGTYHPHGYQYIEDFSYAPTPTITYSAGDITIRKELLLTEAGAQLMIRYTLLEAPCSATLRLRPFLPFRDSHTVSQANPSANLRSYRSAGGVKCRLYEGFPWLYMQIDRHGKFVASPDWWYRFEYLEEQARGYPFTEDIPTPGYLEVELQRGQSLIFSCSSEERDPNSLQQQFKAESATRSSKTDFLSCLRHSARQFLARRGNRTEVVAGYPWFGRWGRDTFIALPGIALTLDDVESCREVLDTMTRQMEGGLFPNMGSAYNSVDAPLWFFWTLQQLGSHVGDEVVWHTYGAVMKKILDAYRQGVEHIQVHENGLLWASNPTHAMTWMDAVVDGRPVTGRDGYQVEINALWYNAVCYTLELAHAFRDTHFTAKWKLTPQLIKASFLDIFWLPQGGYLADYVDAAGANDFVRPNQIIACSLEHCMLSPEQITGILTIAADQLLTPKGLRTLSPNNSLYCGHYGGDQPTRDRQYHQGTVWPWLSEHYVAACFRVYGHGFVSTAQGMLTAFEEDLDSYGIGSICEIYDGSPPHRQCGAISQAWSVGALLRIAKMIEEHKHARAASPRRTAVLT